MDIDHCDYYEAFLKELAFGKNEELLTKLHENACNSVEPLAENVEYTDEDDKISELHDAMDDCWDNTWINPLTGIPHYHAANQDITQIPTMTKYTYQIPEINKCNFCFKKYGDVSKSYTHTIKNCYALKNTQCLLCFGYGHTTSYCKNET